MRTVTYKSVREGVLRLAGLDPTAAAASDKLKAMEFIAQALKQAHEHWRWPELCAIEERYYRAVHVAGTTYAAPTTTAAVEVYFPATGGYYQTLKTATNHDPALLTDGEYALNTAYWAECAASYDGPDWADATDYAVEDVVRRASDGRFYACHTAHTSAGSFDTTKFGVLTPFRKYVAHEQTGKTAIEAVVRAWDADPRTEESALPVAFEIGVEGVRFAPDAPAVVWIDYRARCPDFTYLEEWASGAYASGAQVYHATTGELYRASSAITNEVPGVAAAWVKIDVPYWLEVPVKRWAHALLAGSDGVSRKGLLTEDEFRDLLDEQVWQFTKLQGQQGRTERQP